MKTELLGIVTRTTKNIIESHKNKTLIIPQINIENESTCITESQGQSLLRELLQTLFDQCRLVVTAHTTALRSFSHVNKKYNLQVQLYSIKDVWNNIQEVVSIYIFLSYFYVKKKNFFFSSFRYC